MTQILIAAFDRFAEAEQVKAELVREGVSHDDIQLSASMNPEQVDSSRVEVIGEEPDEDATVADKIGSFFHKVFGAESSQHAGRYPEAARRGSTIVTVSLEDEAQVPAVERIMEHNGAIDIDERSATWGDDATPVTASTETLTTGYPDATSISIDDARTGWQRDTGSRCGFRLDSRPRGKRKGCPARQHRGSRTHHPALGRAGGFVCQQRLQCQRIAHRSAAGGIVEDAPARHAGPSTSPQFICQARQPFGRVRRMVDAWRPV